MSIVTSKEVSRLFDVKSGVGDMRRKITADFTMQMCGEGVAMSDFLTGVKAFFDYINILSEHVVGESYKPCWFVSVKEGSQVLEARRDPEQMSKEAVKDIRKLYKSGPRSFEKKAIMPEGYPEKALNPLNRLAHLTGQRDKKKTRLKLFCVKSPVPITQKTESNTSAILRRIYYEDYGSVEGKLLRISSEYGLAIGVKDDVFGNVIECKIENHMLEQAMKAFDKRVEVFGLIRYDKKSVSRSITVKNIRVFPEAEKIPTVEDFDKLLAKLNA